MSGTKHRPVRNVIVVSDLHCGCQFGLCPPRSVRLDGGGTYTASRLQRAVWAWWTEFWRDWVPDVTRGEPYAVVVNGDAMDGRHHNATTQISQDIADQVRIAADVLRPVAEACKGHIYMVRGTEAHTGQAAENEEMLAEIIGALPDEGGNRTRYDLWLTIEKSLVHIAHHIGVCGSTAYETTALCREYQESCAEAARWNLPAPAVVVRSHRHRLAETRVPTAWGYGVCVTTPGWQLRTPFAYKTQGGRLSTPQVGGIVVRHGDEELYTRHRVWNLTRSPKEVVNG